MPAKLTKNDVNLKKFRRINGKSLRQVLIHTFLHKYGFEKGEIVAAAIVDDILKLITTYFIVAKPLDDTATHAVDASIYLNYGQLVWLACPVDEYPERGKDIAKTRMKPVILTFLADEDVASIQQGFSSRQLRINRMVRWCDEALDQGALLSQLDLAVLLNCCDAVVSDYANEYQRTSGRLLPTRGNIHDLSGAITHKKEIITLYLQGHLTPTIAKKTRHSKEAVDRYIRDFEAVKLVRTVTTDLDQLSLVTRLSKKVVQQYLDLLPPQPTSSTPNH